MHLRLLLLVAAVSSAVVTVSCGTAARCSPQTCATGCCDQSGLCQSGSATGACGSRGNTCSVCGLGTVCSFGTCLGSSGAGTSGAGGGASGVGGGSSGVGGGTSGVGGGTSGVGGGSSGVGGGSSGVGGGSSGVGGGSSGVGGGSSGVGGGSSGVGGGSSGVGGGNSQPCDLATNPTCPAGSECVLNGTMNSAGTCKPGACGLVLQNCASSAKCVIGGTTDGGVARVCLPPGSQGLLPGASCTPVAADPCIVGSQCVNNTCRQFCGPSTNCGAGNACNTAINFSLAVGAPGEIHLVCGMAMMNCNPFTQSPCTSNEGCLVGQGGTTACTTAGTSSAGGTCNTTVRCARGLQCISTGGANGVCRPFCNTDGGLPSCAQGACQSLMAGPFGACSL